MRRLIIAVACCVLIAEVAPADEHSSLEFYEAKIRPILVNRCYECHDGENAEGAANLRLDYRGGWQTGGDSGPAIAADKPEQSLLLRAISYDDPDLQMPPRSKMPDREIELLRQWIASGAIAPDTEPSKEGGSQAIDIQARRDAHWAWQPVARPEVPPVADDQWPQDDIDRFVLAKLEAAGLKPADAAQRSTWLRRVTFDLTGLPPTVEEIEQFLADDADDACERVVDRLLASKAFGECWAQHWLDLMRYAETRGHEGDYNIPHAWRYRDYAIRAFNSNVPYNQLVVEHIAGDLMPVPRIDAETRTNQSIQATAWWHLGEATHAPVDIRGEEADRIDNQIDVFGKAFLGMTVACARCHDHKFDAISSDDYYALCGFIQSSSYQLANVADPELQARLYDQLAELNRREAPALLTAYTQQAKSRLDGLAAGVVKHLLSDEGAEELSKMLANADHPLHLLAVALHAEQHGHDVAQAVQQALDKAAAELSAEATGTSVIDFATTDGTLPYADWRTSGVGYGEGPVDALAVLATGDRERPLRVIERPVATNLVASPQLTGLYRTRTFEVTAGQVWYRYRGKANVFLAVDSHRTVHGPLHTICPQSLDSGGDWAWYSHSTSDYLGHRVHVDFVPTGGFELAEVRQSDTQPGGALHVAIAMRASGRFDRDGVASATVAAFAAALERGSAGEATPEDAQLINWLVAHDHCLPPASGDAAVAYQAALDKFQQQRTELQRQIPAPQYSLALVDGSSENEFVHLRGSHKRLAESPTPRRLLTALGGEFPIEHGSGRLELAQRIASGDNPLVARTYVNRIWAHLMGGGIVSTVDNLGVLGQPPTHPELLDYLASEFVDGGWNTKALIRRVVLSSTYRQQSQPSPAIPSGEIEQADPANRLLHASRVRRIPAEAIRDSLLAVSGELDPGSFGPSVQVHITDFMRHNRSPKGSGPLDGECRRSIYVEVRRNAFNHFLEAFDKPLPFTAVGYRHVSNSAAQPLMLLNDPLVHHLMDKWSESLTAQFDDDSAAARHAFLTAYARPPSDYELQQITSFVAAQQAKQLPRETAWRDVCLTLVNSKEFVFLK
ncbi:PSD1 and planctomycete cytochrome C domain-containing protein [Aeoliella sp. ICT_H6.2]|uniref:PSD1 and planctomycete cytochrome C domain-containing protein n=1 Tax=Aeoliella straminimaris TaxID=2954799 RepID=A0A9X2JJP4_9BACT|nr:PSD1 and planctomycete cytochrome C domain-containing protein [Aeoliella straminimaris]